NIITRTFEMEDTPFPVQLEFLVFKKLTEESSKLEIHIVFKSIEDRDKMLQLPFAKGLSLAHNRLEKLLKS
ncbi:MAG: ATPase, partial [Cytophagales bacterium]|nr:ATPase [Cytophagales bacterium]